MESINPRDLSEIDLSTIEYLTLKNGNMIILDETVPQKQNKSKKNNIEFNKHKKFFFLSISEPIIVSFKSFSKIKHIRNKHNYDNIIIFKNDNIFFQSIKQNNTMKFSYKKKYNKYDLKDLTNKVEEFDKKIIDAFIERMEIVKDINNYKKENNLSIYDLLTY